MLKETKGNMYGFITHTWNPIKGDCPHSCRYCYVHKYGNMIDVNCRLDETCLKDKFGTGKFIFVGSGIDLFAKSIPDMWMERVLDYCHKDNTDLFGARNLFLFQSKDAERILYFLEHPIFKSSVICTTLETNRYNPMIMRNSPLLETRAKAMLQIADKGYRTYVTVEPVMKFDEDEFIKLIQLCRPEQVNIGKNTNQNIKAARANR